MGNIHIKFAIRNETTDEKAYKIFYIITYIISALYRMQFMADRKNMLAGTWCRSQSASPVLTFYKGSRYSHGKNHGDYALVSDHKLKLTPDSGSKTKQTSYICRFSLKGSILTIFNGNFAGSYKKIISPSPRALLP